MKLSDASVLLTGAGGGIGSVLAQQLHSAGAKLLLTDIRSDTLEQTAAQCTAANGSVSTFTANVTDDADRSALVRRALQVGVNVLINVAGVNPFGLFAEQSDAEVRRTIEINVLAPMLLSRAMIPVLGRRDDARIVNVGSTFGSIGFPGFCAYSSSKFAIHGFSEALRRELADSSIAVHYVAPRATRTALSTGRVMAMNQALGVSMDAPEKVSAAILRVLEHRRRESFLGWPERLFVKLNAVLPGLVDRSIARQLPIIRRHASPDDAGQVEDIQSIQSLRS